MRYLTNAVACMSVFVVCGSLARAEVIQAGENAFSVHQTVHVSAAPSEVYRQLVDVAGWWEASHTFSGKAENLYLEVEPHGWFGERLPEGGFVRHLEVIYAVPNKVVRLQGALGPMQPFAIQGTLTWELAEDEDGTRMQWTYHVGGSIPGGLEALAKPVDTVLHQQIQRLKAQVEGTDR